MENDIHVFVLLFTGKEKRDGKQAKAENIYGTRHKSMVTSGRMKPGKMVKDNITQVRKATGKAKG